MTTKKARMSTMFGDVAGPFEIAPTVVQSKVDFTFPIPPTPTPKAAVVKKPASVIPGRPRKKPAATGTLQHQLDKVRARTKKTGRR